jgi:hypothetical protein
MAEEEARIT